MYWGGVWCPSLSPKAQGDLRWLCFAPASVQIAGEYLVQDKEKQKANVNRQRWEAEISWKIGDRNE